MDNADTNDIIELDKYAISFMPSRNGFLYIEADSFTLIIKNGSGKIYVEEGLSKFYLDNGTYVNITDIVHLRKIKFINFKDVDLAIDPLAKMEEEQEDLFNKMKGIVSSTKKRNNQ